MVRRARLMMWCGSMIRPSAATCMCLGLVTSVSVVACRIADTNDTYGDMYNDSGVCAVDASPDVVVSDGAVSDQNVSEASQSDAGVYVDCNAQLYRGYCIDALVPTDWGFDARCVTPPLVPFKPWFNGIRHYWSGNLLECGKVDTETAMAVYCCQ